MPSEHTTDDHLQESRILSTLPSAPVSDNKVFIPSWIDKKTGEHVVLLRDIQNVIGDAHCVRRGKRSITFMLDDDLNELQPKRIRYSPGVAPDVVVASRDQEVIVASKTSVSSRVSIQGSISHLLNGDLMGLSYQADHADHDGDSVVSVTHLVNNLSIAASDADTRNPITLSGILGNEEQTSLHQYGVPNWIPERPNSFMKTTQIPIVDDCVREPLGRIKTTGIHEDSLSHVLVQSQKLDKWQQELGKRQQELDKRQQELDKLFEQQALDKKLDELHQLLQQGFEKMSDKQQQISNSVQALTTQNYELHEYEIPRLFIVLPKAQTPMDKFRHLFKKQFRLYFLCECGEHTTGKGQGNLPNKIHFAKHEGYDLDQPSEFFEKYGSYVLTILEFLKCGTMAAGLVVPALAILKVADGLDAVQKYLTTITKDAINQAIKHIQDLQGNAMNGGDAAAGPMRLEDVEALQGADLRQLDDFLKRKDKCRSYGNLSRIVTPEGHVKWVCADHDDGNYQTTDVERFNEVISKSRSGWIEEGKTFIIELGSSEEASDFYEAMVKGPTLPSLNIILEWDVSLGDLKKLSSAVNKANTARLRLDVRSKETALDFFNWGHRFSPVLELMCNGRIEEMNLRDSSNFYKRMDVSSITTPFLTQKISLPLYTRTDKSSLAKFLKRCPFLVELELEVSDFNEAFEDVTADLTGLPHFKSFTMNMRLRRIVVEISQCKIQSMNAFLRIGCIWSLHLPGLESLFRMGHLTELDTCVCSWQHASQLANMMQWNPRLREIKLFCSMEDSQIIMDAITSTRERMLLEQGYFEPLRVSLSAASEDGGLSVDFEFRDEPTTIALNQDIRRPTPDNTSMLSRLFLDYGQCIKILTTRDGFNDELAAILYQVTDVRGSRITSLELDATPLTNVGLESMMRVIERSQDLQGIDITFRKLEEKCQQKKLKPVIRRCGKKLRGLKVEGDSEGVWVPKVMDLCSKRRSHLESLCVNGIQRSLSR